MTIFGIGTQIVDCTRVATLVEKHGERFLMRCFSHQEIERAYSTRNSTEYYSSLWACKQAILRALGDPWRQNTPWQELEIKIPTDGEPTVTTHGAILNKLIQMNNATVMLTVANCHTYATATAIIVTA